MISMESLFCINIFFGSKLELLTSTKNTYSTEITVISRLTNLYKMPISEQKKTLRRQMRQRRTQLDPLSKSTYDAWICRQLWKRIEEADMQTVHCYLPMRAEINIRPLIERLLQAKIRVVTPKSLPRRELQHFILESLDRVEAGVFGTTFPAKGKEYTGDYDLIIVPGLAFDERGNRLGYGGGYYDNFLIQHPTALKLGIFYPFQRVEQLPLEAHDCPLDDILYQDLADEATGI